MYAYAGNNPVRYTDPDGRDIEELISSVKNAYDQIKIPSKKEHFARNEKQRIIMQQNQTKTDALKHNFEQLGIDSGVNVAESMDRYHEMGTGTPSPAYNDKYVLYDPSGDGRGSFELVFDANGELVTDSVNQGTYNFCDPNNSYVGHFFKDVLPYYIWGNSPDDPTTMWERITGSYQGDVNISKKDAAELRLHKALRDARIW